MTEFEEQLRNIQPAASTVEAADLLYRCGWEAALASKALPAPPSPTLASKSRAWWGPFSGGAFLGVISAVLVVAWLPSAPPAEVESPVRLAEKGDRPNPESQVHSDVEVGIDSKELALAGESVRTFFSTLARRLPQAGYADPILKSDKAHGVPAQPSQVDDSVLPVRYAPLRNPAAFSQFGVGDSDAFY